MAMKKMHPYPAIPIIANDPFFSIWDMGPTPYSQDMKHWTGAEKITKGFVRIDGAERSLRWMGRASVKPMNLKAVNVSPMSTAYVYEDLGVRLTIRFTSPLLTDDLDIMSTPITYLEMETESMDGKEHTVRLVFTCYQQMVCGGSYHPECWIKDFEDGNLHFGYMAQKRQMPLAGSGDHVSADWGYLWFCSESPAIINNRPTADEPAIQWIKEIKTPEKATLLLGFDDGLSINYFGRYLSAYYTRGGKTIVDALKEFHARQDEILGRCKAFDEKLISEATRVGGKEYADIVAISYRQSLAGHKLVQDDDGNPVLVSKENDSNACAATVDVAYAGCAMYLYYSPELTRAMLRPALKFAKMPVWEFDFAPHDVGRYPHCTGQVYSATSRPQNNEGITMIPLYLYPAGADAYTMRNQYPIEECGNMLLMLAGASYEDGDYSFCKQELPLLKKWCDYLIREGRDPSEQLCTDDFTGHLAHNANLAAKAFMGVRAFSDILVGLGETAEAEKYRKEAEDMAKVWLETCFNGEHTSLTLDGKDWSIKYNLVWDKLFGWNVLPEDFYKKELQFYTGKINEYGLPMDPRADYTKPEWSMSITAMMLAAGEQEGYKKMITAMAKFLKETEDHVPFCDLYDTVTGLHERFYARTVVGGTFMPLVMDKWKKKREK